jgi:murein DD-endopeptidase MepM/ murein hydrolase activator NlpD
VAVQIKNYPEQRLTIKDKRKVEPNPDDMARIEREKQTTDAIKRSFSAPAPATDFSLPASGPLSSRFGLRRIFNGLPRNPHAGLDVAAGAGTLSAHRPMAWWSIPASTFSTGTRCSSTMVKA